MLKAKSLLMTLTGLAVELMLPPSTMTTPFVLPMMPSFSIVGAHRRGAGDCHRDAGAGVDDVVLVDQDVGVGDSDARPTSGLIGPSRRVADQRAGDREAGDLGAEPGEALQIGGR